MALIEDVELDSLRKLAAMAQGALPSKRLIDALGADPKSRKTMLKLIKEKFPAVQLPELEKDDLREEMAALRRAVENRNSGNDPDTKMEQGRAALVQRGFTNQEIADVERMMVARENPDYEAVGSLYREANMPVTDSDKDWGGMVGDGEDNPWADAVRPRGNNGQQYRAIRQAQNSEIKKFLNERGMAARGGDRFGR